MGIWINIGVNERPQTPEGLNGTSIKLHCGIRIFGIWSLGLGSWNLGLGAWSLERGIWNLGLHFGVNKRPQTPAGLNGDEH